jgi:hypothetical protein
MDISETLAPKSDQQNFDDYRTGPRTVTVSGVVVPGGDQPVSVELAEYPGRPFKPNKSMRRILAAGWGAESSVWVGRRLTLFGNPAVIYGGKAVGGIEIAAMSDLTKPLTVSLTATRGKRKPFTVHPLPDAAPNPAPEVISDKVKADTAKAITEGKVPEYLAYLAEQGAPKFVTDYVQEQAK